MSVLLAKVLPYVLGLLLVGGLYFGWAYHERKLGAAEIEKSNAEAIAAQNMKDAVLNKQLAIKLQARVTQLEEIARRGNQSIDAAPVDPGSAADEAAAAAVNEMLGYGK